MSVVELDGGALWLAPRRGRWRQLELQREPASTAYLGTLQDALAFGHAPESVRELLYDRFGETLDAPAGHHNPLGGAPFLCRPGYAVWGPFAERVWDVEQAFFETHPGVTTLHAHALEASADGLRETLLLNRRPGFDAPAP